jgi:hypothetical protein
MLAGCVIYAETAPVVSYSLIHLPVTVRDTKTVHPQPTEKYQQV